VSAAGIGALALRELLISNRSAVCPDPDLVGLPVGRAPKLPRSALIRRLDRSAALFVTAASEAWSDAGLPEEPPDPARTILFEGSSLGAIPELIAATKRHVMEGEGAALHPSLVFKFMTGAGGAIFATIHKIRGAVLHFSAASVSASSAIGEAYLKIAHGEADLAVAGGGDAPLQPDIVSHFRAAGILADNGNGQPACRPFSPDRTGTVLGEGAGVLVLEAAEHARRRGVAPRAVLRSYVLACEAYGLVEPDPTGAGVAAATRSALAAAKADTVGWIKAHGTGTRQGDAAECAGFAAVFGERLPEIPVTSIKPTVGHLVGACGALETVATVLALEMQAIPGTIGIERIDPELPACHVPGVMQKADAMSALVITESFGGRSAALLLERL
jgi:3-oxoacyl-[acyl-carrier-protein] synthase II